MRFLFLGAILVLASFMSCTLSLAPSAQLSIKMKAFGGPTNGSSRVLLDDEGPVYVEAHADTASGAIVASAILNLQFGSGGEVTASGAIPSVPLGSPLVIVGEVRDGTTVLARGVSKTIVPVQGANSLSLTLVPQATNPRYNIVVYNDYTSITIPKADTRYLQVQNTTPSTEVRWTSIPDLTVSVYAADGSPIPTTLLEGSGVSFSTGPAYPFLMIYNGGSTNVTITFSAGSAK